MEHRSSLRFGFRILTGSIFILKKFKNGVVLVKKKKSQRVATGFLTGFYRLSRVMVFLFFHQPDPVPASKRPSPGSARSGVRPSFKDMQTYILASPMISICQEIITWNWNWFTPAKRVLIGH
jgi:hypothetical protein